MISLYKDSSGLYFDENAEKPLHREIERKDFIDKEMLDIDLIHRDTYRHARKKKGINIVFLHCIHLWIQLLVSSPAEGTWD